MNNKNRTVLFIFYLSVIALFILYLFPGSLIGYFLYNELDKQPNLISNPAGTSINHFIYFIYLSIIGLFSYLKEINFNKVFIYLFLLSIFLEVAHSIIPNRSFQLADLISNILGVIVAYSAVKIYLLFNKL